MFVRLYIRVHNIRNIKSLYSFCLFHNLDTPAAAHNSFIDGNNIIFAINSRMFYYL